VDHPSALRRSPFTSMVHDQMAAQFPLAPMVVAELAEDLGVLAVKPRLVVLPDDPRLGPFREMFAGRMGFMEIRPQKGPDETPGFAGSTNVTDSDGLHAELSANPYSYVDERAMLRARLLDILVGDWDRHSDQWRWARYEDGHRLRWVPIPRDRDWAFPRVDGILRSIVRLLVPQYVGFGAKYPRISRLTRSGRNIDRATLSRLGRADFMAAAREVAATLTDDVLRSALVVLPPQYRSAGDTILVALRSRRDNLTRAARDYYEVLARTPRIRGTSGADSVAIISDGRTVRVKLFSTDHDGLLLFDRTFLSEETRRVELDLVDGADHVVITGAALPIKFRVSTGAGGAQVVDRSGGKNIRVHARSAAD